MRDYYSAVRKNEIMNMQVNGWNWEEKKFTLSEVTQIHKDKHIVFSPI